jgi:hypothetical protein
MPKKDGLVERLVECLGRLNNCEGDLRTWTESLKELPEFEDAFEAHRKNRLYGKTVLDVGTDCVKRYCKLICHKQGWFN